MIIDGIKYEVTKKIIKSKNKQEIKKIIKKELNYFKKIKKIVKKENRQISLHCHKGHSYIIINLQVYENNNLIEIEVKKEVNYDFFCNEGLIKLKE